jgi:hypothetical protein
MSLPAAKGEEGQGLYGVEGRGKVPDNVDSPAEALHRLAEGFEGLEVPLHGALAHAEALRELRHPVGPELQEVGQRKQSGALGLLSHEKRLSALPSDLQLHSFRAWITAPLSS